MSCVAGCADQEDPAILRHLVPGPAPSPSSTGNSGSPVTPAATPPSTHRALGSHAFSAKRYRLGVKSVKRVKRSPSPLPTGRSRVGGSTASFQALLAAAEACQASELQARSTISVPVAAAGMQAVKSGPIVVTPNWRLHPRLPAVPSAREAPAATTRHASQAWGAVPAAAPHRSPLCPLAAVIASRMSRVLLTMPPEDARCLKEARTFLATF